MAFSDYKCTAAGAGHMTHNGVSLHTGRKFLLDPNANATKIALAAGFITAATGGETYDDGVTPLQQYTVQSAGSGHLLHNGTLLTTGQHLNLDPLEATTIALVNRGLIA